MKGILSIFVCLILCFSLWGNENSSQASFANNEKIERPKVGLILAGGGAKGFAHLPVIKAIEKLGIPVDFVAGTSIGAIVGGLYACGYTPDEIYDLVNTINWADFFKEKTIKYPSNIHFNELQIPFRAVATNLLNGESEILEFGDIAEVIRASMSIPGIFTPAKIGDKFYIDGGVTNNLPIEAAIDFGCDIIIAVEISDDLETEITAFDSNYFVAVAQMYYMTQAPKNRPKYPLADFVFIPDLGNYNFLSFKNGQEIWDLSEKSLEPYMTELEKIRDRIYETGYKPESEPTLQRYNDKDWITITELNLAKGYESDLKFVNNLFEKIKDKPLTDEVYNSFVSDIYESGNYESVNTRIK